eukprot:CAMPEP_0117046834 /NCGR_PEP_ID=MMETSP0472-20121206/32377_1 /TAXON_ID=693140 ORGANISM="Tiarina fusus, Strain LIS" /NCGR_SAMPLE_ID=MMETSP0472 /ASSEMBLY_ACC=CAM_ASM_000603 /LENGTH=363 /DNA_ID=CAMNT_0004759325 /DNA_START=1 /DNA_END=1089 /DNA_ORIENTATION=+
MKLTAALLFCFLVGLALCQNNCDLQGPYICSGGVIQGIDFGDDEDDDFFEYFTSSGDTTTTNSCSVFQQGTYEISGSSIDVEFEIDDDECVITGDSGDCECVDDLSLSVSNNCGTITGPNGETCTPADTCSDSFTCPGGETPIDNPNNEPDANGCGPSAFPLAGPSFSFLECCEQHDFCYGTCGTSKVQCDNDFYECMACTCETDYDDYFSRFACRELACTYFQAVDEFGCFAFTSGQEDSCSCPGKEMEKKSSSLQPTSKFGPVHPTARQTELFCDAPFEAECSAEQPTEKPNSPIPNSPNTASYSPNTASFSPNTVSNSPNSPNSPNTVTFSPNTVTFSPNTFSQVDDDDDDSSDAPLLMW